MVHLVAQFDNQIALRSDDASKNHHPPVFVHLYDSPTARDAAAALFPFKMGPWLYKALTTYGVPEEDWKAVTHALIDRLAELIKGVAARYPQMHVVETRSTLREAAPGTAGPSNDWINEIHPTKEGYALLAAKYSASIVEQLNRPTPSAVPVALAEMDGTSEAAVTEATAIGDVQLG